MKNLFLISILIWVVIGCDEASVEEAKKPLPRPVKVTIAKKTTPDVSLRLTGNVASWKQEEISFEVGGKLDYVIDAGEDVDGPVTKVHGKEISKGTVLAKLETEDYELKVEQAKLDIQTVQSEYKTTWTEVKHVIPAQLAEVRANLKLAQTNYNRLFNLRSQNNASQSDLDEALTNLENSKARLRQTEAQKKVKEAVLLNIKSQERSLYKILEKAQIDLAKCVVRAPYDGRVAYVHGIRGGYVQPGKSVLTLVLMDPIKITAAVSAKTDRQLSIGDFVTIYHPDWKKPATGWIYSKDTVADAQTRTFKVQILVRNFKFDRLLEDNPEWKKLPQVKDLIPVVSRHYHQPDRRYVAIDGLHKDEKGYYVWRTDHHIGRKFQSIMTLSKMRLEVGDVKFDFLGLYVFRSVVTKNNLPLQKAIAKESFIATGVPKGVKDGDQVVFSRENWLFRPGELVKIDLNLSPSVTGYYVPIKAILEESGRHYVFIVNKENRAQKVPVQLFDHFGETRRIEGKGIGEGTKIVMQGTHYLLPGERVTVLDKREI